MADFQIRHLAAKPTPAGIAAARVGRQAFSAFLVYRSESVMPVEGATKAPSPSAWASNLKNDGDADNTSAETMMGSLQD